MRVEEEGKDANRLQERQRRQNRREEGGGGGRRWQWQDTGAGVETVACSSGWHGLYHSLSGLGTGPSAGETHTQIYTHKQIKHKDIQSLYHTLTDTHAADRENNTERRHSLMHTHTHTHTQLVSAPPHTHT